MLGEGRTWIPQSAIDARDEESRLDDIADAHLPSIPEDVMDEYGDDSWLCEMSDICGRVPMSFEQLALETREIDDPMPEDMERIRKLRAYADANGWNFEEGGFA